MNNRYLDSIVMLNKTTVGAIKLAFLTPIYHNLTRSSEQFNGDLVGSPAMLTC